MSVIRRLPCHSWVTVLLLAATCWQTGWAAPRVVAWGNGSAGLNTPAGVTDIKAMAIGPSYGLLLRSNGLVVAWGDGASGQTNIPSGLSSVAAIAAGADHCLALRSNGTVTAWGLNSYGQTDVPASLSSVMAIAAGTTHSLALRSNGTVVAWGGILSVISNVPSGLSGVAAISAGDAHSLVLRSNGTLVAWGDNDSGQTNLPSALHLTNIMAIAAGYHHNLAVRSNGTVVAWDANVVNVYGESTVPAGLSNVVAVAGGYFLSLALKSNGTVVAWGQNFNGETNVPAGLTNVFAIGTGRSDSSGFCAALTPSAVCPPGFPDNFECRSPLTGTNVSFQVSNTGATSEPGEPAHFDLDSHQSLWYTWTAPSSGGAVISANAAFACPLLAVYTGNNLASLTKVVANTTTFSQSRAAFTAVAGTSYQVAVDGTTFNGSSGNGNFNLTLNLTPPPTNDLFVNSTVISNDFLETSGSFLGASREAGEPLHTNFNGDASFQQTLWWSWTAPTNLGVSAIPASIIADAVSFPPNIGVYTGTSVSNLTLVPGLISATNGMTRTAGFIATAGTTYRLALAGSQAEPQGIDASPRVGSYRFRFNIHALALGFRNVVLTSNGDDSTTFHANLQVTNFGSASSYPLRVQVTANSGVSVLGQDSGFATNNPVVLLTTNLPALPPLQGLQRAITGVIPPPAVNGGAVLTNGVGYGAYGQLQEQVATNWFTVDQQLLAFGDWPSLNGLGGPGGGVIRLDPSLTGAGFNPLASVSIQGPATVFEGAVGRYNGLARYANSYQYSFTNTTWGTTRFTITNGVLSTGIVTSNSPATISAIYSSGGFNYNAATSVTILDLPPPTLSHAGLAGTNFTFQIQGVSNRTHVIEVTTALTNPVLWLPLSTNVLPSNGVLNFTNAPGTNRVSFYRARELN